jgi:hypothetical protein
MSLAIFFKLLQVLTAFWLVWSGCTRPDIGAGRAGL